LLPLQRLACARDDLAEIIDYGAARDEKSAMRLLDTIDAAVSALPEHPLLYRRGRVAGTREMVVHPHYFVVYRLSSLAIEIVAILHTSKQFP
jgi:plasmid stabilization system protein ParE